MTSRNLKPLDGEALLIISADDEYDSDETIFEEEDNVSVMKCLEPNDNILSMSNLPVKLQTQVKSSPSILSKGNALPIDRSIFKYNNLTTGIEANSYDENWLSDNLTNNNGLDNSSIFSLVPATTHALANTALDCIESTTSKFETNHWPDDLEYFDFGNSEMEWRLMNEQHDSNNSDSVNETLHIQSHKELNYQSAFQNTFNNNKSRTFNNEESSLEQEKQLHLDINSPGQIREWSQKKGGLNTYTENCSYIGMIENKDIASSLSHLYDEIQIDVDDNLVKTENSLLDISSENLAKILGIEAYCENMNASTGTPCSPPLTLIERGDKRNIASKKIYLGKRKCMKECGDKRILPARKCQSKYIDESNRFTLSQKPTNSDFYLNNSNELKMRERKIEKKLKDPGNDRIDVIKAKGTGFKPKSGRKCKSEPCAGKEAPPVEISRGSLVQHLKEMETTLHQTEERVYKWVNGEEHGVSREKAFDMLMQTQGIIKILESSQVPRRSGHKISKIKDVLCKRAQKLAYAIDAVIAESDLMFEQECLEKIGFHDKAVVIPQVIADIAMKSRPNNLNLKLLSDTGLEGIVLNHHIQDNLILHNVERDLEKENMKSKSNLVSVRSLPMHTNTPEMEEENYSSSHQNQERLTNNLKPILKILSNRSSSESATQIRKHISFSDDIEFYYLSGNALSSQCSLDETTLQSPSVFEANEDHLEKNTNEDSSELISTFEETHTSNLIQTHSLNSLSQSEILSEGFGFTEEFDNTNLLIWGDVSLTDIKYLRIKSPGEFAPTNDYKSLNDLDKW